MVTEQPHEQAVRLETSLDFLNTFALSKGSMVERFETANHAIEWLADHGALDGRDRATVLAEFAGDERTSSRTLSRIRRARGALREVADAVIESRPAEAKAVALVNDALRCRSTLELKVAPDGVRAGSSCAADPISDALAHLAEPIAQTLAEGRPDRLHECANPTCGWVFYDGSPTGRRRWCEMSSCGNQAKAARHRARIRMVDAVAD